MDSPFFRGQWSQQPSRPRHSPAARSIPVQRVGKTPTPSKVISIPVHFLDSAAKSEADRSASALKIQKALRGFLVRKCVKKIVAIRREVDEIERRISRPEIAELVRANENERLRVNETLMALLFKLDTVPGIDSGVRDCRKAVIKKAIALQEKVDALIAAPANQTIDNDIGSEEESVDRVVEVDASHSRPQPVDHSQEVEESPDTDAGEKTQTEASESQTPEEKNPANQLIGNYCLESGGPLDMSMANANIPETMDEIGECEKMDVAETGRDTESANDESCVLKEVINNGGGITSSPSVESKAESLGEGGGGDCDATSECYGDVMEEQDAEVTAEDDVVKECVVASTGGGREDNRGLLEKMMEDNKTMMSLMTELFEKNEAQTKMLNTLTLRVEQLEKAFVCDRLRKKKKNMHT